MSAAGASTVVVNTAVEVTAGASYRAGSDIITSIRNNEMTISSPNRYLTSAISGAVLYNSRRIARKSASLGIAV